MNGHLRWSSTGIRGFNVTGSRRVSEGKRIFSRGSVGGSNGNVMADDDVLFEDVYELCEVIGK